MLPDRLLHRQPPHNSGFTLLEVILVLVLIGIFTVVAIAQHSASDAAVAAQAQVLAAHLRYAQMRAMNTDTSWGILYSAGGGYYQLFRSATEDIAQLPGEERDRVDLAAMGMAILSAAAPGTPSSGNFTVQFDSWGSPQSTVAGAETLTLQLTQPGHTPQTITVTRNTGFIP